MKFNLKDFIKKTLFFPKYFYYLPSSKTIKPFFGFIGNKISGRQKRVSRLIEEFGNHFMRPNILYVGSQWGILNHESAIDLKYKNNCPIILNQNGIYYPGWYNGDYKERNAALVNINKNSNEVIYQSKFCKDSLEELTGKVLKKGLILHNCIPPIINHKINSIYKKNSSVVTCFIGGVFNNDAYHILLPALRVIELLNIKQTNVKYILKIGGVFTKLAQKSSWYNNICKKINVLKEKNLCLFLGQYNTENYYSILSDVDIALHLKYKDPCPNAVIEKIKYNIPHIFSNSGGTPELIGNAGIGLLVRDSWEKQEMVSTDQLYFSIIKMSENIEYYRKLTTLRSKNFFLWKEYIDKHISIFQKFI